MESHEYQAVFALEGSHWWYRELHHAVLSLVARCFRHQRGLRILDAGCGTGGLAGHLGRFGRVYGVDVSSLALRYCQQRAMDRLLQASVAQLPFRDAAFDLVVSVDVIYHRGVDSDVQAIAEWYRVLKPGGLLILHVPAYDWLRRPHDEQVHTRHRYTRSEIRAKLLRSQFRILKASYRNAFLLPAALCVKLMARRPQTPASDLRPMGQPMNDMLAWLLRIETWWLRIGSLPCGTSVLCVAQR